MGTFKEIVTPANAMARIGSAYGRSWRTGLRFATAARIATIAGGQCVRELRMFRRLSAWCAPSDDTDPVSTALPVLEALEPLDPRGFGFF